MSPLLELLVVVSANVLGAGMALPQAVRLLRTRRVEGVSPAWAAMSASVNAWWAGYGLGVGHWAILPVTVVSVVAYAVVIAALVRLRPELRHDAGRSLVGPALGIALVPLAALAGGGWTAVGVALGLVYGVQLLPAVVTAYRSATVDGIAAGTWILAWTEAALWGVYGLDGRDAGLVTLAVTGTAMATAVLVRLAVRRPPPDRRWSLAG